MIATTTFRAVCAIVGLCAFFGLLFQEQLVVELKHQGTDVSNIAARYMLEAETADVEGGVQQHDNNDTQRQEDCANTPPQQLSSARTTTTVPTEDEEDSTTTESTTTPTPSTIQFNATHPLFVLNLKHSGVDLILPRYFECAGYQDGTTLGRHWTRLPETATRQHPRMPIGQCMLNNLRRNQPLTNHCGKFHVWTDVQYLLAPNLNPKRRKSAECFDIVLHPQGLQKLYEAYPDGATILNIVQDPITWYQQYLSDPLPQFWSDWCSTEDNNMFPTQAELATNPQRAMVGFYMEYQHRLQEFVKEHPTWNYVEVDLRHNDHSTIALQLQQSLGIESQCWIQSSQGNITMVHDPDVPSVLSHQVRPNEVTYPMLVTAMPKSGTSTIHDYFRCGMYGSWVGAHQWSTVTYEPHPMIPVGECLLNNTNNDRYPFLSGCGTALVWSDTGVLRQKSRGQNRTCYFPFLHRQGLERFYRSYPHGTILNAVRNTTSWVQSAMRWRQLPKRWVTAHCDGMPTNVNAPNEEWEAFYDSIHTTIRQFAADHPTLTYIEIPLNDQTGIMLKDVFGFPEQCWGHKNVNTKGLNVTTTATTKKKKKKRM